jgi:NOL1/NOP2/sun family putative RNA methylase
MNDKNELIPPFLNDLLDKEYGIELKNKIIEGYKINRLTTLRVNTLKSNKDFIINYFNENKIEYKLSEIDNSFILLNKTAKDLYETDIVKNGLVYLQSLSSMLPAIYLDAKENEDILDMAAAPGGKTTLIAALTNNKAHITAVEIDKIRCDRLKYNILKQGASSVFVLNTDAKRLDDYFSFNKILLDAPCSGSGTIYLNEKSKLKISKELVNNSAKLQAELLKKALKILKPDSYMIYSTCSILKEENENVLNKILPLYNCEIVELDSKDLPTLPSTIKGVITVMPNELYEGFFIAKIHKK